MESDAVRSLDLTAADYQEVPFLKTLTNSRSASIMIATMMAILCSLLKLTASSR